jgi:hypothetical protein
VTGKVAESGFQVTLEHGRPPFLLTHSLLAGILIQPGLDNLDVDKQEKVVNRFLLGMKSLLPVMKIAFFGFFITRSYKLSRMTGAW